MRQNVIVKVGELGKLTSWLLICPVLVMNIKKITDQDFFVFFAYCYQGISDCSVFSIKTDTLERSLIKGRYKGFLPKK